MVEAKLEILIEYEESGELAARFSKYFKALPAASYPLLVIWKLLDKRNRCLHAYYEASSNLRSTDKALKKDPQDVGFSCGNARGASRRILVLR